MSTETRMLDVIYRVGEWKSPPFWRPFAFRRWQERARAELHRLFELRCAEEREYVAEAVAEHDKALALKLRLNDPVARSFRDMFGAQ